jgi:hypothetical protein
VSGDVAYGSGAGVGTGAGVGSSSSYAADVHPGQIVGQVVDVTGAPIPGATVTADVSGVQQTVVSDSGGNYVFSALPSGPLTVTAQLAGFVTVRQTLVFDQRPRRVNFALPVGAITESVTVQAEAPIVRSRTSEIGQTYKVDEMRVPQAAKQAQNEPSANVQSLQRRASGVLPVRMEVPRAGTSHRFVKPLVIDEPALVSFRFRKR